MGWLWDTCVLSTTIRYNIGEKDDYTVFTPSNGGNTVQVKISTLGVERANTIAIYENTTVFNGHYQELIKFSKGFRN